ncbi:hypothetical protein VP01_8909g1, partial [Puccinia sorghi]
MKEAHLCHKGLTKYIPEEPVALAGAATEAVNKKHAETPLSLQTMRKTPIKSEVQLYADAHQSGSRQAWCSGQHS